MADAFLKDPSAVLDYEFDWSAWLGADTIASHTVTAEAGVTVMSSSATSTATIVWLSGGTAGTDYDVTNQIVTAGGRTDERTMLIRCVER